MRGVTLETQKCPHDLSPNNVKGTYSWNWGQEVEPGRSPKTV